MRSRLTVAKVFYVGQLEPGGTCRDRMLALRDLGCEVEAFDTTPYLRSGPRIMRSVAHRWNVGPRLRRLNDDLLGWTAAVFPPESTSALVWIDKGRWIFPDTLRALRERFGARLVHFTPDPQFRLHKSRHFVRCTPHYDLMVTTKAFEVEDYWQAGARRVILTGQAYDERRTEGARPTPEFSSDVCFIGHRELHYERTAADVDQEDVTFRVWGPGWNRGGRDFVEGEGLWGRDYYDALSSAHIGLGLLSKRVPETSTTRTFEIPACGTLLLAERTSEHQRYFEEGKEAEFFDGAEEMRDKVRYYTRNDRARERLAAAGRRKCREAGYGNRARLKAVLDALCSDREYSDLRFLDEVASAESRRETG